MTNRDLYADPDFDEDPHLVNDHSDRPEDLLARIRLLECLVYDLINPQEAEDDTPEAAKPSHAQRILNAIDASSRGLLSASEIADATQETLRDTKAMLYKMTRPNEKGAIVWVKRGGVHKYKRRKKVPVDD